MAVACCGVRVLAGNGRGAFKQHEDQTMEIIFALQVAYWLGKTTLVAILVAKALGWF